MQPIDPKTDELLCRAAECDEPAIQELLETHRGRLKQLVVIHMDNRLRTRVDPSDVVQETLMEASSRLPEYASSQPIPFYPWLRQITLQQLGKQRRHHLAQKRSMLREKADDVRLSDDSILQLADRFASPGSSPSQQVSRREMQRQVRKAVQQLSERDREVLVL